MTVVYVILSAYAGLLAVYMFAIVVGAWLYRPEGEAPAILPRIAVIMPAHNEEGGIAKAVSSVLDTDYPSNRLSVFVLADNCTDRTAEIAESSGATVWVRTDDLNRGKGQALDWALRTQAGVLEAFDLITFIDADMNTDRAFFSNAARYFTQKDVQVVQGRYTMSADDPSWLRAMAFASFAYVNHIRPAGRCFWGGTAGLKGGGMVFRRDLILRLGWPAHSITEDVELGARLLREGVAVIYAPNAVVTSTVPVSRKAVRVQQTRWEGGRLQLFRDHFGSLFRQAWASRSFASLDALFDATVPPLSLLILLCGVGAVVALAQDASIAFFACCFVAFALAVLSGLIQLRASPAIWVRLALAPGFFLWKLSIMWSVGLSRTASSWTRTPRNK